LEYDLDLEVVLSNSSDELTLRGSRPLLAEERAPIPADVAVALLVAVVMVVVVVVDREEENSLASIGLKEVATEDAISKISA